MVRTGATVADACAEYLRYVDQDRQRKPSTIRDYDSIFRNHVLPHLGEIPLEDLTAERVERWAASEIDPDRVMANRTITTTTHTSSDRPPAQAAKLALRSLAHRVAELDHEIAALDEQLIPLVATAAPRTTRLIAISTGHAGQLLVTAGQNIERLRSGGSFAALCGASPIPVSSGRRDRYRLNHGGDRDANRTLHMIAVCRLRYCARTRAYAQRRIAEGKTKKEIIRCLKRYTPARPTARSAPISPTSSHRPRPPTRPPSPSPAEPARSAAADDALDIYRNVRGNSSWIKFTTPITSALA